MPCEDEGPESSKVAVVVEASEEVSVGAGVGIIVGVEVGDGTGGKGGRGREIVVGAIVGIMVGVGVVEGRIVGRELMKAAVDSSSANDMERVVRKEGSCVGGGGDLTEEERDCGVGAGM